MLNYTRHFVLLLGVAAVLAAASRLAAVLAPTEFLSAAGIACQFAIYGALHALALVSSFTARPSLGRRIAFIAAAAATSLAIAWSALVLVRRNMSSPAPILIAAAALGAWAYAYTIRRVLRLNLGARSWVTLGCTAAVACAAAVAGAYPVAKHFPGAVALALAIPWWLAFSVAFACKTHGADGEIIAQ